jgi:threonine/homoserine/homoserine lactone efflux protein
MPIISTDGDVLPELSVLVPFLLASIGLTLLPGPDNLFVLSLSIVNGSRAGIPTALGMAIGNFAHTAAVALGLSALILASPLAFSAIKALGVMYLLYLAWQSWKHPLNISSPQSDAKFNQLSGLKLFQRGVLMNLLNPKVALFFLALFPQFVDQASEFKALQIFVLGTVFVIQAANIFCTIALAAGQLQPVISRLPPRSLAGITSGLFIMLSVYLAISELGN